MSPKMDRKSREELLGGSRHCVAFCAEWGKHDAQSSGRAGAIQSGRPRDARDADPELPWRPVGNHGLPVDVRSLRRKLSATGHSSAAGHCHLHGPRTVR